VTVADIPPPCLAAAERAIIEAGRLPFGQDDIVAGQPGVFARVALEVAAPILAKHIAAQIHGYAAEHEPAAITTDGTMRRSAWRGHFHIATHIALGLPLCANCALPIMRLASSSTGWTHDSGSPVEGWQGVRCPGLLCGATEQGAASSPTGTAGEGS
jgi:hypothetical protein